MERSRYSSCFSHPSSLHVSPPLVLFFPHFKWLLPNKAQALSKGLRRRAMVVRGGFIIMCIRSGRSARADGEPNNRGETWWNLDTYWKKEGQNKANDGKGGGGRRKTHNKKAIRPITILHFSLSLSWRCVGRREHHQVIALAAVWLENRRWTTTASFWGLINSKERTPNWRKELPHFKCSKPCISYWV